MEKLDNVPRIYLSSSEGRFRVIHSGVPISSDQRTREEALAVAKRFRLEVAKVYWDGDAGEWRDLT